MAEELNIPGAPNGPDLVVREGDRLVLGNITVTPMPASETCGEPIDFPSMPPTFITSVETALKLLAATAKFIKALRGEEWCSFCGVAAHGDSGHSEDCAWAALRAEYRAAGLWPEDK